MLLKDGVSAQEYAKKISDVSIAEKICVWNDFKYYTQNVHSGAVNIFKKQLKNPNSYTDIGSSYTYDVEPATESGKIHVKNFVLTLRYTATNSFGGTIQDVFECAPIDL